MKCVLDTTVNLKRLVAKDGKKLMFTVNGKTILEQQFAAMKQAGISSVFVLIGQDEPGRGDISREAIKYGYNVTFLDVEEEVVQNRRSIMSAQSYLKQDFIYLPVNRLISAKILKAMINFPINHQILSVVFAGRDHPHIDKNSVFRMDYTELTEEGEAKKAKDGSTVAKQGYDIGVYKCSPIVFKLIDKVAQNNKVFSWNRLQSVLSRAGRNVVLPTTNVDWCVIESKDDIMQIEGHKAKVLVDNIELNGCDKKLFGNIYRLFMPEMIKSMVFRNYGLIIFGLLFVIGGSLILMNQWIVSLPAGILMASVLGLQPVFRFIHQREVPAWFDRHILSACRFFVLLIFSVACYLKFGAALWVLGSILLLGAEVYFIARPVLINEPKLNLVIESFSIHAIMLMIASVIPVPTLSLLIFGLLAGSISITKGQQRYKEIEREREDAESVEEGEETH